MKERKFEKYIYGGVTAALVLITAILTVYLLVNLDTVVNFFDMVVSILAPVLVGAVLAFLVSPIYNKACRVTGWLFQKNPKSAKRLSWMEKTVGTLASLVFVAILFVSLFYLIIPQLYFSLVSIIDNMSVYVQNISEWLTNMFANNPELEQEVLAIYQEAATQLQNWASTNLIPSLKNVEGLQNIGKLVGGVSSGVVGILNLAKNLFLGLIVMIYILNIKRTFAAQGKRLIYAFLPLRVANATVDEFRFIHNVFSGFIIGKLIDSLIIGVLCFILMKLIHLPFELLISVIIGVTNIIPFFGPLIGAIPSAILVFLISPIQCLYFVGLILLLQQFDGNILGPKILGNSTGLSSFWVFFSILLFGGLFGFIGMVVAVPVTAVIFDLFAKLRNYYLRKKNLTLDEKEYDDLKRIDEASGEFVKREDV